MFDRLLDSGLLTIGNVIVDLGFLLRRNQEFLPGSQVCLGFRSLCCTNYNRIYIVPTAGGWHWHPGCQPGSSICWRLALASWMPAGIFHPLADGRLPVEDCQWKIASESIDMFAGILV
jgi:hypothetical protein